MIDGLLQQKFYIQASSSYVECNSEGKWNSLQRKKRKSLHIHPFDNAVVKFDDVLKCVCLTTICQRHALLNVTIYSLSGQRDAAEFLPTSDHIGCCNHKWLVWYRNPITRNLKDMQRLLPAVAAVWRSLMDGIYLDIAMPPVYSCNIAQYSANYSSFSRTPSVRLVHGWSVDHTSCGIQADAHFGGMKPNESRALPRSADFASSLGDHFNRLPSQSSWFAGCARP